MTLREQGVRDLGILRAIEAVPREMFVDPAHAGLAQRNIALPIACGQTVPSALFLAHMLAGCRLRPDMRVLVVGMGSGYSTAVLAHVVDTVVALERFQTLVEAASARLTTLGLTNVAALWADGCDPPDLPPFDRVLMFGASVTPPPRLQALLQTGGAIVHARNAATHESVGQMLVRVERQADGVMRQTLLCPSRLPQLRGGLVPAARI